MLLLVEVVEDVGVAALLGVVTEVVVVGVGLVAVVCRLLRRRPNLLKLWRPPLRVRGPRDGRQLKRVAWLEMRYKEFRMKAMVV